jgi:hypothetical protein
LVVGVSRRARAFRLLSGSAARRVDALSASAFDPLLAFAELLEVRRDHERGGWKVVSPAIVRTLGFGLERDAAIGLAEDCLLRREGGQIRVLNETGKVTDSVWIELREEG